MTQLLPCPFCGGPAGEVGLDFITCLSAEVGAEPICPGKQIRIDVEDAARWNVRRAPAINAEAIARTICLSYGRDPDALTDWLEMCDADNQPVPTWRVYEEQAEAVLKAHTLTGENNG